MIHPIHVLGHAAGRPDCPPDIAAAILWSIQNLGQPVEVGETVQEPVSPIKVGGYIYPGRKPSISYDDAVAVFAEYKINGNKISKAAETVGVSYNQAWAVCRGKTYPEIADRKGPGIIAGRDLKSFGTDKAYGPEADKRRNLSAEEVKEILVASQTMKISEIAEAMDLQFGTVSSIINRRTVMSRQVAENLGMDTPPVKRLVRRPNNITPNQKVELLAMLARNDSVRSIAKHFDVSSGTVRAYRDAAKVQ